MYFNKLVKSSGSYLYLVFRLLIGLVFFIHGSGKLFGWFGGSTVPLAGLFGVAGVIETLAGLGILLGFFTRLAAVGGLAVMIGALVKVHLPQGWNPLQNGGEPATLFFAAFLVLIVYGAGMWSLERALLKKEYF